MKGDFTRDTFHPENHYERTLMQQGRVQMDADWNEQAAINVRRHDTAARDLIGDCGGPADHAAFGAITDLLKAPPAVTAWFTDLATADKNAITAALGAGDFLLGPGRYYVEGIQTELEQPILFSRQPDAPGAPALAAGASLLYLHVWQRHLTALEVPALLDPALNGVDTATRVKTVWQVQALPLVDGIPKEGCGAVINDYTTLSAPSTLELKAQTKSLPGNDDPCLVPETVGYKGLENQLYRVEIHETNNDGAPKSFKWSRENGAVTARLIKIDAGKKQLTVESLGRNPTPDFGENQFVEILDDTLELSGKPGELIEIDRVDAADLIIVLKKQPTGAYTGTNLKIRRWDGFQNVKKGSLSLEAGIQIEFTNLPATCRTGDYWLIPARAAGPTSSGGDIEWPRALKSNGQPDPANPIPQLRRGPIHHYRRLGYIDKPPVGASKFTDCRCLWPPLTSVPRLFYVSGDGQEVTPDPNKPNGLYKLRRPLIVGLANPHCFGRDASVKFTVINSPESLSDGRLAPVPNTAAAPVKNDITAEFDSQGLAKCEFHLDGVHTVQQVSAQLLDWVGDPVSPPIIFNANLSIASEVAYAPNGCPGLKDQITVQTAIDQIAGQLSLYKISGDNQTIPPGGTLAPVRVQAANRCGPVPLQAGWINFTVVSGAGNVSPLRINADGTAECDWTLGPGTTTQELEAKFTAAANPTAEPTRVVFTARIEEKTGRDPGIHILKLRTAHEDPFLNDTEIYPLDLDEGIIIELDRSIAEMAIRDKPSCFVTVEMPFPMQGADREFWRTNKLLGFEPLVLAAETGANDNQEIRWLPPQEVITFLTALADRARKIFSLSRVLARLTIKGNVIWGGEKLTLDGEAFGRPAADGRVDLDLDKGSGNGRRGGDFEMWFWLLSPVPVITDQPGSFTPAIGANIVFSVKATGPGALKYQWNKNGIAILGANASELRFANVRPTSAGDYSVTVSNEFGSVESQVAKLSFP